MAFFSLMVIGVVMAVLAAGLLCLIIGVILDIVWGVKRKKDRKVGKVHKFFAVFMSVLGALGFLLPVLIFGGVTLFMKISDTIELRSIDNLVRVPDEHFSSFEFNGVRFVRCDYLFASEGSVHSEDTAFAVVDPDNGFTRFYRMDNSGGFDIYLDADVNSIYVPEDKLDTIRKYYENEAHIAFKLDDRSSDDEVDIDIDRTLFLNIRALYDEPVDYSTDRPEKGHLYLIGGYSDDHLYYTDISINCIDNMYILEHIMSSDGMQGHVIPEDYAASIEQLLKNS